MNIILFAKEEMDSAKTVCLRGRRLDHIARVIKPDVGDQVRVGVLDGLIGHGEVLSISGSEIKLRCELVEEPPIDPKIRLFVALPRPKNLSRILQTITQLGIKDIHIFHSYRVEKSFWTSDYLSENSVREALLLGLEQAVDTMIPKVCFHRYFRPFVEDVLPGLSEGSDRWMAHPYAKFQIQEVLKGRKNDSVIGSQAPENDAVSLVIGPEGGLIDFEIGLLENSGFKSFSWGRRVLKVETAIAAITSFFISR